MHRTLKQTITAAFLTATLLSLGACSNSGGESQDNTVAATVTKPIGVGVLNNRHKATGEVFEHAVASMVALNDTASAAARSRGSSRARHVSPRDWPRSS